VRRKTRSSENAERKARLMDSNADPLRLSSPQPACELIKNAVDAFLRDEEARQLAKTYDLPKQEERKHHRLTLLSTSVSRMSG
jgi:phage terminase Nu1 subunit (DNA packaging protein)